ncbi:MAG TPA: porin [Tepidisphaeraceae bacterium]
MTDRKTPDVRTPRFTTPRLKTLAPALAGVLATAAIAAAADPTAAELRQQIEAMQQQINKIEAKAAASDQTQTTIENVLGDADRRSQLLQAGGLTAGYDGKFFVRSADGNFSLSPTVIMQFRSVTNYGEDTKGDGEESLETGLELRRVKLGLAGNAFSKDLQYNFRLSVNRNGGESVLDLAYVQYKFADDWAFKVGQYKANVFHEELISDARQLAVERSLVNALIGGNQTDYVQGAALIYQTEALRAELAYTDGANTDNTDFQDGQGGPNTVPGPNYGVDARVEYKVMGDWKRYDDFTALKNESDLLVFGVGADYTEGGDSHTVFHTVDALFKQGAGPISAYAAYIGQYNETDDDDAYNWGGLAQVGYLLPNTNWEPFARYSYTDIDDGDNYSEITLGTNYYFAGHNAKFSLDVNFLPDGSPSSTGLGYLDGDDFQFAVRGQFQLSL